MNRRSLLAGVGGVLSTVVAGCLSDRDETGTTSIADVEFETDIDVDKELDDDPSVSFEDEAIRVTGRYSTGNSCYGEHLEDPVYDEMADELRIELTRRHDGSDECESVEQLVSYRVVVHIDGSLPNVVDVTEEIGGEIREERGSFPFS
jgi:hypothetical protein